ncbi:hypothetical protein EON79_09680 [bacterium]|nr:MAG: hypothetical protein EON79_09680 [bacterium]
MKAPIIAAVALLAGVAAAQTDTASALLSAQFNRWRGADPNLPVDFRVEMNGTEEFGSKSEPFRITAYHHREPGLHQLEIVEYRMVGTGMAEVSRIVADGRWLWRFDRSRLEFTAVPYDANGTLSDEAAENALFAFAAVAVRGNASWPLRLMREIYTGPIAQYRSWQSPSTLDTTQVDPTYRIGDPTLPRRELRWALDTADNTSVLAAAFFDRSTVRNIERRTTWTMSFAMDYDPAEIPTFAALAPNEYRSWRAIPWARLAGPSN